MWSFENVPRGGVINSLFSLSSCFSLIPVQNVCWGHLLEGWGDVLVAGVFLFDLVTAFGPGQCFELCSVDLIYIYK